MKDDVWLEKLRQMRVPARDPVTTARARHRAQIAFSQRIATRATRADQPHRLLRMLCGVGASFVLAAGIFLAQQEDIPPKRSEATHGDLWAQCAAIFPQHLIAVIEGGDEVEVELSEKPIATRPQEILVSFQAKDRRITVLSFSGNEVCLDLTGRRICFETLLTEDGEVIVSDNEAVWTSSHPVRVAGLQMEAKILHRSL